MVTLHEQFRSLPKGLQTEVVEALVKMQRELDAAKAQTATLRTAATQALDVLTKVLKETP